MNLYQPQLKFNNPIDEGKLDEIISLLEVEPNDIIVDIGGGNGEVLLKMLHKSRAKGILIDSNEELLETCRKRSEFLIQSGQLALIAEDANVYLEKLEPNSVDCFVCLGASYALGGYLNFVKVIAPYLKPGGFLLIGEEFWMTKPSQKYLDILGGSESESRFHFQNIEAPEEMGLTYLYSHVASEADWNKFEGVYFLEEELKAQKLSGIQKQEHLDKLRAFRRAQFEFGRSTMGFGLYLFRK